MKIWKNEFAQNFKEGVGPKSLQGKRTKRGPLNLVGQHHKGEVRRVQVGVPRDRKMGKLGILTEFEKQIRGGRSPSPSDPHYSCGGGRSLEGVLLKTKETENYYVKVKTMI